MEREIETADELVDLGAASVETRGINWGDVDGIGLMPTGLSDD